MSSQPQCHEYSYTEGKELHADNFYEWIDKFYSAVDKNNKFLIFEAAQHCQDLVLKSLN